MNGGGELVKALDQGWRQPAKRGGERSSVTSLPLVPILILDLGWPSKHTATKGNGKITSL